MPFVRYEHVYLMYLIIENIFKIGLIFMVLVFKGSVN